MYDLLDLEEDPSYPVANIQDLEEDPSYPVENIQEALSHLSPPLSTWLEEQEANFKEVATQGTEKQELMEMRNRRSVGEDKRGQNGREAKEGKIMRNRRSVGEGDFQQALCEVDERVFRPRAARRSVNLNDTQVSS